MYILKDNITDQRLSYYSPTDDKLWEWNEGIHGNLCSNVHVFDTKVEAQAAILHLETAFRGYGETDIDFIMEKVLPVKAYKTVGTN